MLWLNHIVSVLQLSTLLTKNYTAVQCGCCPPVCLMCYTSSSAELITHLVLLKELRNGLKCKSIVHAYFTVISLLEGVD